MGDHTMMVMTPVVPVPVPVACLRAGGYGSGEQAEHGQNDADDRITTKSHSGCHRPLFAIAESPSRSRGHVSDPCLCLRS